MPADTSRRLDAHVHLSQYWKNLRTNAYREDIEFTVPSLLREMDQEGIHHAVLLQLELAPTVAETLREGRMLFEQSRGRLLPTSTVDPTKGSEEVASAIALWEDAPDLVALKLYPGYLSFYPHDSRLAPLYEFAHRRSLPVMVHQGDTLETNGLLKFARPIEMDEVAVRYRDVRFVLCHLGNPWIEETAELVYKNENVYTDTSGLLANPRVPYFPEMVERSRRRLQNAVAAIGDISRILYGSDWPLESLQSAVQLISKLDLEEPAKEQILGGNARRLFHLPETPARSKQ